jgi:F-type H+-transporting ATPase subunit epsilon
MKIVVSTHQGTLYNEEIDYFTVHKTDGDFGVMKDHIPVIAVMDEGYVKIVRGSDEYYIVIINGILDYHDNLATILVQEAHIGRDAESAKKHLLDVRNARLDKNRQESVDLTRKEKEIRDNIAKSKAGSL